MNARIRQLWARGRRPRGGVGLVRGRRAAGTVAGAPGHRLDPGSVGRRPRRHGGSLLSDVVTLVKRR